MRKYRWCSGSCSSVAPYADRSQRGNGTHQCTISQSVRLPGVGQRLDQDYLCAAEVSAGSSSTIVADGTTQLKAKRPYYNKTDTLQQHSVPALACTRRTRKQMADQGQAHQQRPQPLELAATCSMSTRFTLPSSSSSPGSPRQGYSGRWTHPHQRS